MLENHRQQQKEQEISVMTSCNVRRKKMELQTERTYKDRLIRMIFMEKKENLLSLYNAVNGTRYTNAEDLTVNTLENAIYMNMKNDISFIFDFFLNLYEHQASFNPNMPLRKLLYLSRLLQVLVKDKNLYGSKLVRIPTPRFVVFYNSFCLARFCRA